MILPAATAPAGGARLDKASPRLHYRDTDATLSRRTNEPSSTAPPCLQNNTCTLLPPNHISLPRTPFILTLTLLLLLTLTSTLTLTILLYRRRTRLKQSQEAKTWGRKSRYLNRISVARKQLDDDLRRQYHGVFVNEVVENPEMGSDSPVEMGWEEKVWEVPNCEVRREKVLPALPRVVEVPESVRVREGMGPGVRGGNGGGAGVRGTGGGPGRKSLFFCDGVGVWLPRGR